jgi:hypothetical protein
MAVERHLSAKDIEEALGVPRSRAFQIMTQMPRLKAGRTVRVTESDFNRWREQHTLAPDVPRSALPSPRFKYKPKKQRWPAPEARPDGLLIRPTRPRT